MRARPTFNKQSVVPGRARARGTHFSSKDSASSSHDDLQPLALAHEFLQLGCSSPRRPWSVALAAISVSRSPLDGELLDRALRALCLDLAARSSLRAARVAAPGESLWWLRLAPRLCAIADSDLPTALAGPFPALAGPSPATALSSTFALAQILLDAARHVPHSTAVDRIHVVAYALHEVAVVADDNQRARPAVE